MTTVLALLLVLRVFDRSGGSVHDRHAAIRDADLILRQANVAAVWVDCSRGSAAASHAMCTAPLQSHELAIRITQGPADRDVVAGHRILGYSLVEPDSGGTLATVFSDRVAWLAKASKSPYSALLGRTVAHEVGHLLIGTNEHSSAGLMRAVWTVAELRREERHDWTFTTDDRARLHRSRIANDQTRIAESTPVSEKDES